MTEIQKEFVVLGEKLKTVNTLIRLLEVEVNTADERHNAFVGDVGMKNMEDYSAGILSGLKKAWNILVAKKKQYIDMQNEIANVLAGE